MFKKVTSSLKLINLPITPKKQLVLLSLSIILTGISIISINSGGDYESSYSFTVFAQIEKDSNPKMLLHSQSMANSNNSINVNSTTFSSIGTISSLVITVPENEFNITNAFKVILTGDWVLNVHNRTITNFEANFLASPMDGSRGHIHQITNFSTNENVMNQLTPDNNSLSVNGTADIKINGKTIWNNVDLSIIMSNGSTITIDPNDKQTDNHFGDQQVYGIVNRLIVM